MVHPEHPKILWKIMEYSKLLKSKTWGWKRLFVKDLVYDFSILVVLLVLDPQVQVESNVFPSQLYWSNWYIYIYTYIIHDVYMDAAIDLRYFQPTTCQHVTINPTIPDWIRQQLAWAERISDFSRAVQSMRLCWTLAVLLQTWKSG